MCSGQQMCAAGHTLKDIWSTNGIYHLWQLGEREIKKNKMWEADRLPESPGASWGTGAFGMCDIISPDGHVVLIDKDGKAKKRNGLHERKK